MNAWWRIATPRGSSGAIAIVQIEGSEVDEALRCVGLASVDVGQVRLCNLLGVDRGLIMRLSKHCVQLMPHGGRAVVEAIVERLARAGLECEGEDDALVTMYPEASTLTEARMLAALSRAASPRAIDLLLAQPERWACASAVSDPALDRERNRLIDPPLVVATGPPNIGKSTLLNALAGRSVAIVSDEAGTTRDHVGVMLELDGLTVRYVDTPGVRDEGPDSEREARRIAQRVIESADLLLLCGDAQAQPPQPTHEDARLTVGLRSDLGIGPRPFDAGVSAHTGEGMADLAILLRRRLVSDQALTDPSPWTFWEGDSPT